MQLPRILAFNTELTVNLFSTLKISCSAAETCIYPLPCNVLAYILNLCFQALSSCLKIIFFMWSYGISSLFLDVLDVDQQKVIKKFNPLCLALHQSESSFFVTAFGINIH